VLVGGNVDPGALDACGHPPRALSRTAHGRRRPAASTSPGASQEADVVFGGEAEERVDELVALIEGEAAPPRQHRCQPANQTLVPLRKEARPDVKGSPAPRFDLLRMRRLHDDVRAVLAGLSVPLRVLRHHRDLRTGATAQDPRSDAGRAGALLRLGWRGSVFVVDDNFIGNVKEVRRLCRAAKMAAANGWPFDFYTEASVNLGRHRGLVEQLADCGFNGVFLGIETPSRPRWPRPRRRRTSISISTNRR
jgi:radical SAM superfamily enzyme YgiQ (UPF0313 family)